LDSFTSFRPPLHLRLTSDGSIESAPPQTLTKPLFIPESKWVIIAQQEIQQQKYKSGRTQCKTETKENIAIACCCRRSCGRKRFVCQHIFYARDDDEFEVGDVADDNDDNLTPDMKQKESDACGKYYVN